uniref:GIY-YIG domain-containing protein n=1 Tax=viral metagenome TaxID=1070528 RepID=A0A6C0EDP1_9ZZZZ
MVNYQLSKIYMLIPINNEDNEQFVYIGSTTKKYLSTRLSQHVSCYKLYKQAKFKFCSSYILFDKYSIEKINIILLEIYPCNSKDELRSKEAEYIKKTVNCVNKNQPGRNVKQWYLDNRDKQIEYQKKYNYDNKDIITDYNKKYYVENKDKIQENNKKYYVENKDKIQENNKKWYHENKDNRLQQMKEYSKQYNQERKKNNIIVDISQNEITDIENIKNEIELLENENKNLEKDCLFYHDLYSKLLQKYDLDEYINENNNVNKNNDNENKEEINDLEKKLYDLKIDNQVLHCSLYDFNKRFFKTLYKFEGDNYNFLMNINEKNDDLNDEETKKLHKIFNNT